MKNYNDLMTLIYTNGGATLTLDNDNASLTQCFYEDGYQVAYQRDSVILPFNDVTPNDIIRHIEKLRLIVVNHFKEYKNIFDIGVWLNNGMLYIDLSTNIQDLSIAKMIGNVEDQKALYNWSNGEDVTL